MKNIIFIFILFYIEKIKSINSENTTDKLNLNKTLSITNISELFDIKTLNNIYIPENSTLHSIEGIKNFIFNIFFPRYNFINIKLEKLKDKQLNSTSIIKNEENKIPQIFIDKNKTISKEIEKLNSHLSDLGDLEFQLSNSTVEETMKIIQALSSIINISDYDNFNFSDVQSIEHIEDHPTKNNDELTNKTEWEKKIIEFQAAEILTFEILYDIIDYANSTVKLTIFVNDEEKNTFGFKIIDPKGKLIFSENDKIHIFYNFTAEILGEYKYLVNNKYNSSPLKLTFAVHQGNSSDIIINKQDINSTYQMLENIRYMSKNARFAARLLTKKYDAHYEHVHKHNRNFFLFAMIESGVMMIVFFLQLCYIKMLIGENK